MSTKRSNNKVICEVLGREPVHPFPARMAPSIALEVVAKSKASGSLRVLDPMMGSGTVIAVARDHGHRAVGVDIDPLAVLLARVWTTAVDRDAVRSKAITVLAHAREEFRSLLQRDAYPRAATTETRRFVAYWFDGHSRRQLTSLARAIARVRDRSIRDVLWCAFSRLIIAKQAGASRAMDLSHSRPHRVFSRAPAKPFAGFLAAVEKVVSNCLGHRDRKRGPPPATWLGDARRLDITSSSVDLVLTSPPYLNAIDYLRCSKFTLVWLGYSTEKLRVIRTRSVGSEAGNRSQDLPAAREILSALGFHRKLSRRDKGILARYVVDIRKAVSETARVLSRKGRAVYVVGENTIRGTFIPTARILAKAAELEGLTLMSRRSRVLPANRRYLPPPKGNGQRAALDTRMRREVILTFSRSHRRR